jgi:hypothetical protein
VRRTDSLGLESLLAGALKGARFFHDNEGYLGQNTILLQGKVR